MFINNSLNLLSSSVELIGPFVLRCFEILDNLKLFIFTCFTLIELNFKEFIYGLPCFNQENLNLIPLIICVLVVVVSLLLIYLLEDSEKEIEKWKINNAPISINDMPNFNDQHTNQEIKNQFKPKEVVGYKKILLKWPDYNQQPIFDVIDVPKSSTNEDIKVNYKQYLKLKYNK